MVVAKNEWIGDEQEVGFVSQFLEDFELTDNINDFVKSSTIEEWLKNKNLGVSMKCFGGELKKHCIINKFVNIDNKYKKVSGKTVKVWFGIKETRYTEEIDDDTTDIAY